MVRGSFKRVFRFPFRWREDVRGDIREFEFHLVMRTEELMRQGLNEAEASARARREFGDRRSGEDGCAAIGAQIERKRRLSRLIEEGRMDIVSGLRQIARNPGVAAMAIATLGIALAANTAIFAVVNGLVFKPLPVAAPDELARIKAGETQMAWANYEDIRRANTVFSGVAAYRRLVLGLAGGDRSVRVQGQQTTGNFFSVLGVRPALGRSYAP
jgi:putative ABC transport system permease protein